MSPTIAVALNPEYDSIWQNCSNLGHDMILTTKIRRIFPTMEFVISGLEENKFYKMSIHMAFVDNFKLRFDNKTGKYTTSISRDRKAEPRIVWHPKGSQTGQEWMLHSVSFDHVRISGKKEMEADSENIVHLLSGHRYMPVLTIYENNIPIYSSKIQHMIFNATTQYNNDGIREYKRSINKFSTKAEVETRVGLVCNRKRNFISRETSKQAKQSRHSNFMVENLIETDVPSTSSVALAGSSEALFSRFAQSATPESPALKSIKSIVATPPPAILLQDPMAYGALPQSVLSNRSVLTPPSTPGSYKAEVTTTPSTPTSPFTSKSIGFQRVHGGTPLAAVSPIRSTLTGPSPPPLAFPGFPMMPFPMMPMMLPQPYWNPLFSPFLNPLMIDMAPTQPITPPNDDATPGAIENITDETEEIDIVN